MTATTEAIEIAAELEADGTGHEKPSPMRPASCAHIRATGAACTFPAVKETRLCFHHSAVKTALGRVTPIDQVPYGIFAPIPFVFAEDAASLQINYHLLLQAAAEKRVDHRTGTLLFRILRSMADNLKNPLIAENPSTHREGDGAETDAGAGAQLSALPKSREEMWDQSSGTETTSTMTSVSSVSVVKSEPEPTNPVPAPASLVPKNKTRPADDPILAAAIEALPPTSKRSVTAILAQRDYLHDGELQYFSLPPYDKPENKPKPWMPNPLNPSVQRIIALTCERK